MQLQKFYSNFDERLQSLKIFIHDTAMSNYVNQINNNSIHAVNFFNNGVNKMHFITDIAELKFIVEFRYRNFHCARIPCSDENKSNSIL